ncbi:MAG: HAMP domain-containing protein, partial [Spirochaetaceae bacterium]|nr:HAMP domain-containing protein [Spirochaetaceae bacterium]
MIFRLRSKILLAFSFVILSGMILMVSIINFSTRSGYESFARQNDIDLGLSLAGPLADYYAFTGNWVGVESILQFPQASGMGLMRGMNRNNRNNDNDRNRMMAPMIVLADKNGSIIFQSGDSPVPTIQKIPQNKLDTGIPIYSSQKIIAYIFTGSMLQPGLNANEQAFLNKTTIIIISVSLFILLVSFVFSYFFSWRLTKPVGNLTDAVSEIQSGKFDRRVSVTGNDELSELSKSFNQMAESLENNDKWRKQIIADSAHELRTPVSLIQGNLEMILDGVYQPDKEHLQNIYDETLVLSRLIRELQQLSSAESGSLTLNIEELDLNSLIENVLNIFRAGEVKDKIKLVNSIDSSLPPVKGDYQKLKQVFSNVLANAFRHTPVGGKVEIHAEVSDSSVLVVIEDTGPGIKEDELEKIFERFYRTD